MSKFLASPVVLDEDGRVSTMDQIAVYNTVFQAAKTLLKLSRVLDAAKDGEFHQDASAGMVDSVLLCVELEAGQLSGDIQEVRRQIREEREKRLNWRAQNG